MAKEIYQRGIREQGNTIVLTGDPKTTREAFFRIMEQRVEILDESEWQRRVTKKNGKYLFGAILSYKNLRRESLPTGNSVTDACVYVRRQNYLVDGVDF